MSGFPRSTSSEEKLRLKRRVERAEPGRGRTAVGPGLQHLQQAAGNAAVARVIQRAHAAGGPRNSAVISRLFVLTDKKTYDTAQKGVALGKTLYEKFDIGADYPDIKEATFAAAVGALAAEKERFGGKGQVSEAQVRDEVIRRLTQVVEKTGRAVAWAVETDKARLSQTAYDRLIEVGCTDDNINAAMNDSGSGLWNVIKKLKGQGDLWELKVNGAGAVRCNGKAGAGGKIEFLTAGKGIGK